MIPFDPELTPGARNAVRICLRVQPQEKVTVITDTVSREIAAALEAALAEIGAPYRTFVLEECAPRPLEAMPRVVLDDMESSQVSIFAVVAQRNELRSRMQMTDVVNRRKIRHAHMVNIEKRIMLEGMRADYLAVDDLSLRLLDITRPAKQIRATNAAGTDIVATMNPDYKWLKTSGIISENTWGNLPGGEVWTTPGEVNGTFVVDGVVGDYLCAKYGDLAATPLILRIEGNRLKEAHCADKELEEEFWKYTHTDENSDRVGEFAIGTNLGVRDVIGNILQDEKIPGVHIAFGNPYGDHTGAQWYSSTHIDVVGRRFTIQADDRLIMRAGEFLL
ncbi:aminopeptidase [uncultured Paludibaculum sp.]|uniref:aminopeptidase n=1 Tax=uncultured Paludibaculum sp. TaxID=1765020 RepID=UPI002AAB0EFF|nr:aminopeptidase [uncultured Paludibaculum sp.]